PKDLVNLLMVSAIFSSVVACKQEPAGVKTAAAAQPRSRRPVIIDETDNGTTPTTGTTTTTQMGTTTTTQPAGGGGGGGGGAPALAGTYLGACTSANQFYYKLKYSISGTNVRIDEEYYNDPGCAAKLEASIYTGTVTLGAANGQGYNIDFGVVRTGYYIAPSQDLSTFNDPANPFCGRATGWVHGDNVLEAGNPCRENSPDYRVYNVNGTTLMMSAGSATAAQRKNAITLSFPRQ
ncbi:MAG: hypothetical protein K2X47_17955, partial [Bdellovibrionales bacterium]|nr:hypothetical protein [Bdellovibrionales bacterium]